MELIGMDAGKWTDALQELWKSIQLDKQSWSSGKKFELKREGSS